VYYSAADYYRLGRTYPRQHLREGFPRHGQRRLATWIIPHTLPPPPAAPGCPSRPRRQDSSCVRPPRGDAVLGRPRRADGERTRPPKKPDCC
jgi:hypothetical protein